MDARADGGHTVRSLSLGGFALELETPCDPDALTRERERAGDESPGYWAHVWPAALMLGGFVARTNMLGAGTRVLEIGCGVGLVGIVAAKRGAEAVLTDFDPGAVALSARNAERNGVCAACAVYDWREPPDAAWAPEVLLGSDVLYDESAHEPIARLIHHLDCLAMIADPGRDRARGALDAMERAGLRFWETGAPGGRVILAQRR